MALKQHKFKELGLQIVKPLMIPTLENELKKIGNYKFDFVVKKDDKTYYIEAKGYLHARDIYRVKLCRILFQGRDSEFIMVWQDPKTKAQKEDNLKFEWLFT